jgi:hypothetical protein
MKCILCYVNPILITNAKSQARKGLILYNNANGIITYKKHIYVDHCMIAKIFEERVNNLLKDAKKQLGKKRPHVNGTTISNFFSAKHSYKKDDVQEKQFLEDLILLIVRNHLPMHVVENQWLKKF